jgi:phosphomannomutase
VSLTCVKAYDIRGRLGHDLDEPIMERLGRAAARVLGARLAVVGRDARPSSPALASALIAGLGAEGAEVADLGLCATEEVYFATDHLGAGAGLMVTASHNPLDWNGLKLVREGARPLGAALAEIAALAAADAFGPARPPGGRRAVDTRPAYAARVAAIVGPPARPLRILAHAGSGTAGAAFDAAHAALGAPHQLHRLDWDPDPAFPHGIPNPLLPANRGRTAAALVAAGAELGLAWDGDGDRCFVYDEEGGFVDGELVVALLARAVLAREPGARIVHDNRVEWAIRGAVAAAGGEPVRARTGHAHMKAAMREAGAAYGGEMSAHHYFRGFMCCDSGVIPALMVANLVAAEGRPLSALVAELRAAHPSSGEVNFRADAPAALARVEAALGPRARALDRLDGLALDMGDWRLSLRPSNTEPLLRLNLETRGDRGLLEARLAEVTRLISG